MLLSSPQWGSQICGKISSWIDVDSTNDRVRINSTKVLKQELTWAVHLAVASVILPTPSFQCSNYAQILNQTLQSPMYVSQFWIRIPLKSTVEMLDKVIPPHFNIQISSLAKTNFLSLAVLFTILGNGGTTFDP